MTDRQTDRHCVTAKTALASHRAVKMKISAASGHLQTKKYTEINFSRGPPRTPLGEFTALPSPSWWEGGSLPSPSQKNTPASVLRASQPAHFCCLPPPMSADEVKIFVVYAMHSELSYELVGGRILIISPNLPK